MSPDLFINPQERPQSHPPPDPGPQWGKISAGAEEALGGQLGFQSQPFALSAWTWLQTVLWRVSVPGLLSEVWSQGTEPDLSGVAYEVDYDLPHGDHILNFSQAFTTYLVALWAQGNISVTVLEDKPGLCTATLSSFLEAEFWVK